MIKFLMKFLMLSLFVGVFCFCSDDDEGIDYPFDREVMEMTVLRTCNTKGDSTVSCFKLRYRYPIETERLQAIYLWIDTTVVDDTSKSVSSSQLKQATKVIEYSTKNESSYDTIDLTPMIEDFLKDDERALMEGKKLQVALYCKYSKGEPGAVQRIFLHLGDDQPPSSVKVVCDPWTTGSAIEWHRPTDQYDYYMPEKISGPIVGYNIVITADDKKEDLRKSKIRLTVGEGKLLRNKRIRFFHDSIRVDTLKDAGADSEKNILRLSVLDGKGFDTECDSLNRFKLSIDGLKSMSSYSVNITAWDSSGLASVAAIEDFSTTDSVPPLMAKKIFVNEDSLYPGEGFAALDSNNRLRIFWSRSVDPHERDHGIIEDSVLVYPSECNSTLCYDSVDYYEVLRYNKYSGTWDSVAGGDASHYVRSYAMEDGVMVPDAEGSFVVDTIRWAVPGDTVILKIRARDASKYYSRALIDTIYISPGELAKDMECPEGYVAVSASDTNKFCMERYEHMDDSGKFVNNVFYSDAVAACESVSASGFKVSLCSESDWENVCLSGGLLAYGVIEDDTISISEFLYRNCNIGLNDSAGAADLSLRKAACVNPMGVHDMPGQYQEWVVGRSKDTSVVLKGASYKHYDGLERDVISMCTSRSFPYYTRLSYTTDSVYLYREGTRIDTVFEADTSRTLYAVLTANNKDKEYRFKDSLQFFNVKDADGNTIGLDYAPYSEYKKGGDEWLEKLANGLTYEPDHVEVVFIKKEKVAYRQAAAFYKSPAIGFRCCAYK